jgi:hypothetical protein
VIAARSCQIARPWKSAKNKKIAVSKRLNSLGLSGVLGGRVGLRGKSLEQS